MLLKKEGLEIKYTSQPEPGGTTYQNPGWWAVKPVDKLDACVHVVAGPASSEKNLRKEIAQINRAIKSGEYADR
jgi:hypothetical protein